MGTMQPGGTGCSLVRGAPYLMAGKTGTAQKISRKRQRERRSARSCRCHLRHQALFVGYAPADNPTIAVAVAVEHGGFGASTAGPIARKIFDAWLLGQDARSRAPRSIPRRPGVRTPATFAARAATSTPPRAPTARRRPCAR